MKNLSSLQKDTHKIILKAGMQISKASQNRLNVHTKSSENDLVTQLDLEVENFLKDKLGNLLPGSLFLAEETSPEIKNAEKLWIIDPIDGTTNFVHNFPFIAISVALQLEGKTVLAFIYNPLMNEFFEAITNEGSTLNGKGIRVSATQTLSKSLLATGFAYNYSSASENNIRFFEHFHHKCRGVRRPGSAALDLSYVAKGVFDGFWEWYLHPWDVAAGILLVQEAGGKVTSLDGSSYNFGCDNILVTNSSIHHEMLEEFQQLMIKKN